MGGVVLQFVTRNFTESKKHCEELFTNLLKQSKVQDKCSEAIHTSKPLEISAEIRAMLSPKFSKGDIPLDKTRNASIIIYELSLINNWLHMVLVVLHLAYVGDSSDTPSGYIIFW